MAKEADFVLQNASMLLKTVQDNLEALKRKNFSAERLGSLQSAYKNAVEKVMEQEKAKVLVNVKTGEQDAAFEKMLIFIRKIRRASKSAWPKDKAIHKKYNIGQKPPWSVPAMVAEAEYFQTLLDDDREALLKNGLVEQDLSDFGAVLNALKKADATQESAKGARNAATFSRNEAIETLLTEIRRTCNFAKSAFANEEQMRALFRPIARGRGPARKKTES